MTPNKPQHVNPGLDTTINPIVIDDSYRERTSNANKSRCIVVTSCRECPWLELTTMPGIIDNPDGTPTELLWCLGADDSRIDIEVSKLDSIHPDCPLPIGSETTPSDCGYCSYKRFASNWKNAEAHDVRVCEEERRRITDELKLWGIDNKHGISTLCDGTPFVWWYELEDKIKSLQSGMKEGQGRKQPNNPLSHIDAYVNLEAEVDLLQKEIVEKMDELGELMKRMKELREG